MKQLSPFVEAMETPNEKEIHITSKKNPEKKESHWNVSDRDFCLFVR